MPEITKNVKDDSPTKKLLKEFLASGEPGIEVTNEFSFASLKKSVDELKQTSDFPVRVVNSNNRVFLVNLEKTT